MKILNSQQIKETDHYTITHEPIASELLMERAGQRVFDRIIHDFKEVHTFVFFCGPGNNGGDGLVIARLLKQAEKQVEVIILKGNYTAEFTSNFEKIKTINVPFTIVESAEQISDIDIQTETLLIDALFGIGISKPLSGFASELVQKINTLPNFKIAVDLPSGLSPDSAFLSNVLNTVQANITYTIQLPKLAFMFADNDAFTGNFECVDIGLSASFIAHQNTPHVYLDESFIRSLIQPRNRFGHKGTFGHALIIAGSEDKPGASILSSKAALKSGCGLLTALIPPQAAVPMHTALPEAMVIQRKASAKKIDYSPYQAIGYGPGLGVSIQTMDGLYELLNLCTSPLIIDADGLNSLSENPEWYRLLKSNIILTPHPKEFDRLTHPHDTGWERYQTQQHFSKKHQVTIVLKGHHTSVTTPSGLTYFNSTGNNGMATAGSGDVLTGVITSLCAQGYRPEDAAVLGVYLHGYAGDIAAQKYSITSIIASDIIDNINAFFKMFEK